ncbi:MAG: hypothetical protein IPH07_30730 [Deltaproteobacteria bacterium]|nr:hypothetical protein [Deltaproteobacteria bacterium]MBK8715292.1 hypothetical protein [Deltaproteobacteria bacterium]MBP7285005.1 hypothetical protein [Nannocystaceae bacterium]
MPSRNKFLVLVPSLSLFIGLGTYAGTPAIAANHAAAIAMACDDPSNLCVDSGGAKWEADKTVTAKDKKKRSDKSPATVSLAIDGGRGSLFVNGRYAGTAPLSGVPVPGGRNDVQVRDGATVIAKGVLTVPKGGSVSLTVRHP